MKNLALVFTGLAIASSCLLTGCGGAPTTETTPAPAAPDTTTPAPAAPAPTTPAPAATPTTPPAQ